MVSLGGGRCVMTAVVRDVVLVVGLESMRCRSGKIVEWLVRWVAR